MNSSLHAPGQVISFYSYKGGVGRTMAVANVGRLLADQASRTGQRVLLIDWDLEAPGLQEYFPRCVADSHVGLIDFFAQNYPDCVREPQTDVKSTVTLEDSIVSMVNGLDILPAGRQDLRYAGLVWNFDWSKLVRLRPGCLLRVLIMLNGYAALVGTFNAVFHTNYMYLCHKPQVATLLDFFGPWPIYILAGEAITMVLFTLLYLPFRQKTAV